MFLLKRPTRTQLEKFLDDSHSFGFSYDRIGIAKESPTGFNVDERAGVVGRGPEVFSRACRALLDWRQFDLGWVEIFPSRPSIKPGTVVVVSVNHLGFWSLNGCRVCYEIGNREHGPVFGLAYGTLTNHAELGEEIFEVSIDSDTGDVSYKIRAVSKPRTALARIGYPFTRLLQERFRRDSIAAMRRAVNHER